MRITGIIRGSSLNKKRPAQLTPHRYDFFRSIAAPKAAQTDPKSADKKKVLDKPRPDRESLRQGLDHEAFQLGANDRGTISTGSLKLISCHVGGIPKAPRH